MDGKRHDTTPADHLIRYWLVGEGAQAPERRLGAALDLHARLPHHGARWVWGWARIPLGVALALPQGLVARVTGRSSSFLRGILVHDGLIESEYNGHELYALIYCPWPRRVRHGERIAQMWPLAVEREAWQALEAAPEGVAALKQGFGSTGR